MRQVPPLAAALLAVLLPSACYGENLRYSKAGFICDESGRVCRGRSEAFQLGTFRLGPALQCDSQVGLCWQTTPIRTVNWRATRELFGSTSAGSGWGDWRPHLTKLPLQWQGYCLLRQKETVLYEGACRFQESASLGQPQPEGSDEKPIRSLTITLGAQQTVRFVWDQGLYQLASEGLRQPLSLIDQGPRGVWRWAGMQLLSGSSRADVVPEAWSAPTDAEQIQQAFELNAQGR